MLQFLFWLRCYFICVNEDGMVISNLSSAEISLIYSRSVRYVYTDECKLSLNSFDKLIFV